VPCTEFGPTPWSRECPLPPPAWLGPQLDPFIEACTLAAKGLITESRIALEKVDSRALQDWFHIHAQNAGYWRAGKSKPTATAPPALREPIAPFMKPLYERDGYRCRYCGIQVIPKRLLDKFSDVVGRDAFPRGHGNYLRHGVIMCFSATLDHVVPVGLGGSTDEGNLVTACRCCNYGKADFALDELDLADPRTRPPLIDTWRGLTELAWVKPSGKVETSDPLPA
jgi:5-methylcytosine-specific restriction endonuclease McrA